MILMLLVARWNLSTKEERMLRTSWMAETMIGANEGSRLDPASFWRSNHRGKLSVIPNSHGHTSGLELYYSFLMSSVDPGFHLKNSHEVRRKDVDARPLAEAH